MARGPVNARVRARTLGLVIRLGKVRSGKIRC